MENITTDFALQANNFISEGNFDKAIELCSNGLALYPNYPSAYCVLAKAHYFAEQYDKAADVIKQASKHFPYNVAIKSTANDIANKTLVLEMVHASETLLEESEQNLDIETNENVTNEEEEMLTEENFSVDEQQAEDIEPELIQVVPEEIPDDFNQELELIESMPENSNNEESDIEETEIMQEENNYIDDDIQLESEGNNLDEEFHMVDDEGYFPKYVQQDSIADMLDAEELPVNAEPENVSEVVVADITVAESEMENIEVEAIEDTELLEEDTIELEAEADTKEATVAFMPVIKQHTDSLVFETNYEKSSIELLYEADFDLQKTKIEFDYSWYVPQHIDSSSFSKSLQNIRILHLDCSIAAYLNEAVDTTTDDILSLAQGLKDAKVSGTIEADEEEEVEMPLIASETMAKILIKQKKYDKAQQIYELLIAEKPGKAEYYNEQLSNIKQLSEAEFAEL